ncbi:endonuclease SmrB [Utexia brackfieldae]|uniref:endonuclease SmrB n=1 Tax=Utexia brackfieldae TaxID=3074108 RepID=UPI00370D0F1D
MPMKNNATKEDLALFKVSIGQVQTLKQDTVVHQPQKLPRKQKQEQKLQQQVIDTRFYFSDEYQPLIQDDPIRYVRENADPNEIKKLRRGFYEPEFFLDLHGLTQQEAKQEIAALINVCLNERAYCSCIMYGHGKNILKKQTPMWLAQHPAILGFHQAPKEYGGSAALLFLVDIDHLDKSQK